MASLSSELWSFVSSAQFQAQHRQPTDPEDRLRRFLFSTMDEVRLRHASAYAKLVLSCTDMDDADHFRQGLLRREISRDITYARQRDHSAHTLYNYLLGWYLYFRSEGIHDAIDAEFASRGVARSASSFRSIWPFASLLHDIGYLFEGTLEPLTPAVQSQQVGIGAEVAHDYFNHRFWNQCGIDSVYDRMRLCELSEVRIPDFGDTSLPSVADALRDVGDLENLRLSIIEQPETSSLARPLLDVLETPYGLSSDAFDLWEMQYRLHGRNSMVARVKWMRLAFEALLREGLGGTGLRVLDHGVCAGLLSLLYSTFFFNIYFGLKRASPTRPGDAHLIKRFQQKEYDPLWWFTGVLWGTAATALHNLQQQLSYVPVFGHQEPLRLDEDSLAYLGILVDCLQEWDRYGVSREGVIGGALPLQGVDVEMSSGPCGIVIKYHDSDRAAAVQKALTSALQNWQKILSIS